MRKHFTVGVLLFFICISFVLSGCRKTEKMQAPAEQTTTTPAEESAPSETTGQSEQE